MWNLLTISAKPPIENDETFVKSLYIWNLLKAQGAMMNDSSYSSPTIRGDDKTSSPQPVHHPGRQLQRNSGSTNGVREGSPPPVGRWTGEDPASCPLLLKMTYRDWPLIPVLRPASR